MGVNADPILEARGLRKNFRMGDGVVEVLTNAALVLRRGEFVAIEGRSGSGKSTLLHILGALDEPEGGSIVYEGMDLAAMGSNARSRIRNQSFGFVFQFYHLLPELSVMENALLGPMIGNGISAFRKQKKDLWSRASEVLSELGVGHRLKHRPAQLSGGERQRVAIARALMNRPAILFADEPTGNLDAETGRQIMGVIERLHREQNQTVVMVTHDRSLASRADRILVLEAGRLAPGRHAADMK